MNNLKSMKPESINSKTRSKIKLSNRKKIIILAFALYVTFILLSRVPYIAQNEIRAVTDKMDEKYEYFLVFYDDDEISHYYVFRENSSLPATITLTYTTSTHTLNVETTNIKNLVIDCQSIYDDECKDVFKLDPIDDRTLFKYYFSTEREEFKIIVKTDTKIDNIIFKNTPKPVSVIVDNEEEWWKGEEGNHWNYVGSDIEVLDIEKGVHDITMYFKLILPPKAFFKIEETNTELVSKKIYSVVNKEITFNGSGSNDNLDGGSIVKYHWDFGDDNYGNEKIVKHAYSQPGTYTITLEVTDNRNLLDNTTEEIHIVLSSNDKDMDGMDDTWEKKYSLDTTTDDSQEDPDNDNLVNLDEYTYNTNPFAADTDGDQYSDYDEVIVYKTNASDILDKPKPKDGDGDGEGGTDLGMVFGVVGVVIVIVILLFVFLLMKKRKKTEVEQEEEGKGPGVDEAETTAGVEVVPEEGKALEGAPFKIPPEDFDTTGGPPEILPEQEEAMPAKKRVKGPPKDDGLQPPPDSDLESDEPLPLGLDEEGISPDDLASEIEDMKMSVGEGEGIEPESGLDLPPPPPDAEMSLDIDAGGLGLGTVGADVTKDRTSQEVMKDEEEMTVKDYVRKGALYFKDKKYSEAIIEWQKALDIEPDHPEIVESIKEAMSKMKEQG